jgi:hypothetical protein
MDVLALALADRRVDRAAEILDVLVGAAVPGRQPAGRAVRPIARPVCLAGARRSHGTPRLRPHGLNTSDKPADAPTRRSSRRTSIVGIIRP